MNLIAQLYQALEKVVGPDMVGFTPSPMSFYVHYCLGYYP